MDNHIDPKIKEILNELDRMKDSVIVAGRSAADQDREANAVIKTLRCELECANNVIAQDRRVINGANKIIEASTISMIISWVFAAVCFAGWILS